MWLWIVFRGESDALLQQGNLQPWYPGCQAQANFRDSYSAQ